MKKVLTLLVTPILYILTIIHWIIWWAVALVIINILIVIAVFVPEKHHDPMVQGACRILTYTAWLFPVCRKEERDKVPFPVIYVANHVSFFDLFISGMVLPGKPRGFELKAHFSYPIYGWFITRFGQIPIDGRDRKSIRESFARATEILKNGERNILIMPEGTRTLTGKIGRFKSGAFHLARNSGIRIVPVVYKNLFNLKNKNSIIIKPGVVEVRFLPPVDPAGFESDDALADYVKARMEKVLEEDT